MPTKADPALRGAGSVRPVRTGAAKIALLALLGPALLNGCPADPTVILDPNQTGAIPAAGTQAGSDGGGADAAGGDDGVVAGAVASSDSNPDWIGLIQGREQRIAIALEGFTAEANLTVVAPPAHATVRTDASSAGPQIVLTPDADYVGVDKVELRLEEGGAEALYSIDLLVYPEVRFDLDGETTPDGYRVLAYAFARNGDPLPEGTYSWSFDATVDAGPLDTHRERERVFTTPGSHVVSLMLTLAGVAAPVPCPVASGAGLEASVTWGGNGLESNASQLVVTPDANFSAGGNVGGPFAPASMQYTLRNTGSAALSWSATADKSWVSIVPAGGTLAPGGATAVAVQLAGAAAGLGYGLQTATVTFTNHTNGVGNTTRSVSLALNARPVANAGPDITVVDADRDGAETVTLNASQSHDADGTIRTYRWTEGGTVLHEGGSASVDVRLPIGTHRLILTVADGQGGSGSDSIDVTIDPAKYSAITQYGITWTFDGEYPAGRFVNGDWWVVGPVTISSVSPAPSGAGADLRNGSMINPLLGNNGDDQAYDGRVHGFNAALVVSFPRTLAPNQSLISTQSIPSYPYDLTGEADPFPQYYRTQKTTVNGITQTALLNAAVLTCLAEVPPADAFRPPLVGTDKPLFRASELQLSLLPNVPRPANIVPLATVERCVQRPWIDFKREWMANEIAPVNNQVSYGRDVAYALGDVALSLCVDFTAEEKQPLLYGLVQIGIDHYYAGRLNGELWKTSGGYKIGRKLPILLAGKLLNRSEMLNLGSIKFQEDMATYFGSERAPSQTLWTGWASSGHAYAANVLYQFEESADSSGASWDHEHRHPSTWSDAPFPNNGNQYPWDKHEPYRRLVTYALPGQTIVARMLGLKGHWNHEAYFAYVDRWVYEDDTANWDAIILYNPAFSDVNPRGQAFLSSFAKDMYLQHRATH